MLVTDGEQRAALAAVRALGQAGHSITVCASRANSLAAASRYCRREIIVPSALDAPEEFAAAVMRMAKELSADLILPISEPAVLALLPHRARISALLPMPSLDAFNAICDKSLVLAAAERQGLTVPRQVLLQSPDEADAHDWSGRFPLVIKPIRSVVGVAAGAVETMDAARAKTSVSYAADREELRARLAQLDRAAYPVMVQERIIGPGFAISLLLWDGELRAAFAHRRLREKPPSGGVSVLREGIALDDELTRKAFALLREFNWQGVAMVEFKMQQATGVPYVMEINGRLWGSLQLAIDAGVDFPNLLLACALNVPRPPQLSYRVGTRTRWEWGDVDHLLARLTKSRRQLSLPPDAPTRIRAVVDFISSWNPRIHNEVLRLGDPMPFVRESWGWVRGH